MKNILKTIGIFAGGMFAGAVMLIASVDDSNVIYNDDEKYITASQNKSGGWSIARIVYKNPVEK